MGKHAATAILTALLLSSCAGTAAPGLPALPDLTTFALVRTDAGKTAPRVVTVDQAADVLAGYDVVFIGEAHRNPGNHLAEMA